jgi:hypothetical protein
MKRFRLGTLLLLVVIAALMMALVVQHDRASRRIAELESVAGPTWKMISDNRSYEYQIKKLKQRIAELESKDVKDH